jgi:hypothetical protein
MAEIDRIMNLAKLRAKLENDAARLRPEYEPTFFPRRNKVGLIPTRYPDARSPRAIAGIALVFGTQAHDHGSEARPWCAPSRWGTSTVRELEIRRWRRNIAERRTCR